MYILYISEWGSFICDETPILFWVEPGPSDSFMLIPGTINLND